MRKGGLSPEKRQKRWMYPVGRYTHPPSATPAILATPTSPTYTVRVCLVVQDSCIMFGHASAPLRITCVSSLFYRDLFAKRLWRFNPPPHPPPFLLPFTPIPVGTEVVSLHGKFSTWTSPPPLRLLIPALNESTSSAEWQVQHVACTYPKIIVCNTVGGPL